MTKKLFIIILTLCLAITAMTTVSFGETYGDYQYDADDYDKEAIITGYTGSGGDIVIPSSINGYKVVKIEDGAFVAKNITSVSIPASVETIGNEAFAGCLDLVSVTLSEGLQSIGAGAFADCADLSSITIPSSVKNISTYAFFSTSITAVTLSCGTTYESNSFSSTTAITLTHTYVNGVCSVCNAAEPDSIHVGSLKLHDGYYTTDGSTETSGAPGSSVTGYAYYSDGTLTLNNFSFTGVAVDVFGIYSDSDLAIELTGTNTITTITAYGICADGSLDISGTGSLTVTVENSSNYTYGIASNNGNITISGCTVTVSSTSGSDAAFGIVTASGSVMIQDGSTVNATATSASGYAEGIYVYAVLSISESTVNAEATSGGEATGIYAIFGVAIDDESDVTATATSTGTGKSSAGVFSLSVSVKGESSVTATAMATNDGGEVYAIYTYQLVMEDNSSITANADSDDFAYGILAEGSILIAESKIVADASGSGAGAIYAGYATFSGSNISATAASDTDNGVAFAVFAASVLIDESSEVEVTATATGDGSTVAAIYSYNSSGCVGVAESKLTATASGDMVYGIYSTGNVEITDCEAEITASGATAYAIYVDEVDSNIIISGSKLTAEATSSDNSESALAFCATSVAISNGSVVDMTTSGNYAHGIFANKDVMITDSTVTATSTGVTYAYDIYATTDVSISGSDITATATASATGSEAGAIYTYEGDIAISGSNVSATATGTNAQSAITADGGNIQFTDSLVVADGGIDVAGTVTVTAGNDVLEVLGGAASASATAKAYVQASGTLAITNATWASDWAGYGYVEIALHTHAYDDGVVTTEPTCTEAGVKTFTCPCGDSYTEPVAATGHTEAEAVVENEVAATCTKDGSYDLVVYCSVCGDEISRVTMAGDPATGHTYEFGEFTWAEDLLSAKAVYVCHCGETMTVDATVTMKGSNGVYTMTATVTDEDGTVHTDTQVAGVNLSTIAADYTAVNDAIAAANALNASNYTNFDTVTSAINQVQWNLSVVNQGTVNNYAEEIETAIANLIPVTIEETVNIEEPIEDTDTVVEPDEDESEPVETPVDENPTTGVAVALLPMVMALAGVVSRKRLG